MPNGPAVATGREAAGPAEESGCMAEGAVFLPGILGERGFLSHNIIGGLLS